MIDGSSMFIPPTFLCDLCIVVSSSPCKLGTLQLWLHPSGINVGKAPSLPFLHFGHCVGFIPFCGIIGFLSAFSSGRAAMGSFCCKTVRIPAVDTAVALGLCPPGRFRVSRSCTFWFWGWDSILCNAVGSCSES